jgi:hypothetical protein
VWINDDTYNEEAYDCSSAAVRGFIPTVGGLIGAIATPVVDISAHVVL